MGFVNHEGCNKMLNASIPFKLSFFLIFSIAANEEQILQTHLHIPRDYSHKEEFWDLELVLNCI